MSAALLLLFLLAGAAPQQDLKNPQPAVDANGKVIPGNFTVSICRGTFYDMTPKVRGRDRYTTPHEVRVTKTTGTSARGGSHGTNGTIRLTSGAPGITGPLGDTTIEYDIIDEAGRRDQHVIVKVKVVDCPPPAPARQTPPAARQPTHRTTSCAKCQPIAAALNAAGDKGDAAAVARLSKELDQCELNCRLDAITENIDWRFELNGGMSVPISGFKKEASKGIRAGVALYRLLKPEFGVGLSLDWAKYGNSEAMPEDFSASQTKMSIDTVYNFSTLGDGGIDPYVTGGVGLSRNTIGFGGESGSEFHGGVRFGVGVLYEIARKYNLGTAVRFERFGTFSEVDVIFSVSFPRLRPGRER